MNYYNMIKKLNHGTSLIQIHDRIKFFNQISSANTAYRNCLILLLIS